MRRGRETSASARGVGDCYLTGPKWDAMIGVLTMRACARGSVCRGAVQLRPIRNGVFLTVRAAFIVLARLLGAAPAWVTLVVIGAFSIMLMTWTALYAAGHLFF